MTLLPEPEIAAALAELPGWYGDHTGLHTLWRYRDFAAAIDAVNAIAAEAERLQHHPDIDIRWNALHLTVVTHSAGGVTDADVRLCAALSAAAAPERAAP